MFREFRGEVREVEIGFDPDKRITNNKTNNNDNLLGFDPDKRIKVQEVQKNEEIQ